MKILVADDQMMILKTVVFKLQNAGHTVLSAENGQEALQIFDREAPELVITDLMMPHVNGLELVEHIRQKRKSQVPIIVLSSVGLEHMIVEAFNLGASDYITKPFRPHEMLARVERFLQ